MPFFPADPILMGQVVANVVGNAMRYAGPGAVIELGASSDASQILLTVTDDGPGIPAQLLPHVFDKFVRMRTQGDAGEGTGLGLTIAEGIIKAHYGSIRAESPTAAGRGTRIVMCLPLQNPLK
jgi:two-component system sensor histidine kinase KdpD